jgi:hypothetical protein
LDEDEETKGDKDVINRNLGFGNKARMTIGQ